MISCMIEVPIKRGFNSAAHWSSNLLAAPRSKLAMANTNSRGVSVLLGKDLQAETGCCAFCGQPSSQLDGFRVSCIEESSRSYRWTRWLTKDPKKLNAFFAFVHYLPAAVYCYAVVTLRGQSQLLFLWFGLVFIHAFLSRPLLGWTEIAVPLPHCGKHRGIRKTENKEAEHKSRTRRLFQNKHFFRWWI
mgnify:CR=1 FL=1